MKRLVLAVFALSLSGAAYAQEATLNGTVTDSTGSVLPGVTVQAEHETVGNKFMGITDGRGAYQIPVRVGRYRITVELQGFTTVTRSGVEVLVGQTATVDMQMSPSTLAETITVTGESPLVETSSS
ncbi:MAG TPA: carboxypeptidase-like regulatory domain-containing protein, partial [Vicinamibacterales bacterium]|nr:carboxypeptidase-like regulatory domain-containing protein [Vicinamibacterales bacterium]